MTKSITIAIDAMGGDHGPSIVVPAGMAAIAKHENLKLIFVGDEAQIKPHLGHASSRVDILHTTEVVAMDELPSTALRKKKNSSMRLAINLVRDKVAHACVSAGNTGALMSTARFVLKTYPNIDRPGIISVLPTLKSTTRVIDLGANVESSAEHLLQFAIMGSTLTQAIEHIEAPTVGLLNIGAEQIKGNVLVKETARLLEQSPHINYYGYVEGDDIFKGIVDVIVCDGFVGNVALKTSEGAAKLITTVFKEAFHYNSWGKLMGLLCKPIFKRATDRFSPSKHNGASFIGIKGIVIKSHGGASRRGFESAIHEALTEVENDIPSLIQNKLSQLEQTKEST